MDKNDKLLAGIVAGIAVLVVAAFAVALRQPAPEYRSGSEPEDVAHNYLLAVDRGDYERAYAYLSPTVEGYPPSLAVFVDEASDLARRYGSESVSTSVKMATVTEHRAVVEIQQSTFSEGGLFDSRQYSSEHGMNLERSSSDAWRITHSDLYWDYCWDRPSSCPDRLRQPVAPEAYP